MRPPYRVPPVLLATQTPSFLFARRRNLAHDLELLFHANGNTPRAIDAERIPQRDAFLLVMNHYRRSDIPVWWSVLAAFKAIAERRAGFAPSNVRLIIASQWTYTTRV